ncbi:9990_t:CDS:2 [Gigaspora margarita]|uniref:9990_t:CDS:1 n=1 Tax=Gigaspora margarita TaxID=4874 RepID=A0ABN7V2G7_GIGMA|nr:9990_t:CDS:2 [Gigaspora margarita]
MILTKNTIILFFVCIFIASGVFAQEATTSAAAPGGAKAPTPSSSGAAAASPAATSSPGAAKGAASSVRVDSFEMIIGSCAALIIGGLLY